MAKNMTYADTAPAISTDDLTNAFGDEPRVRDLLLAERLGFKRLTDVRELIGRNKAELEWYGPLFRKESRVESDPAASEAILPCRTVKSDVKPRASNGATKTTQTGGATKTRQPKQTKPPTDRERDVPKESADKPDRRRRGRPTKDYWLNEGQALTICALARTRVAARIRRELVLVFMAYRNGGQAMLALPAPPATTAGKAVVHA